VETGERSTNGQTGETLFCDGTVDDPLLTEAVEQALRDLVPAELLAPGSDHQTAPDSEVFILYSEECVLDTTPPLPTASPPSK
jgi:hypothetical protein